MLQITQTSINKPLSQFVVFEYGQPATRYNDELIQTERHEALQAAASQAIHETLSFSLNVAKRAGKALFEATDTYLGSMN